MTSGSISTSGSIQVVAGSTIVTPASMCARLMRSRRTASSIGELGPRVDTCLERLGGDADRDLVAVSDEQADRVGQVELALGVVRLDPVERRPELLGSEHVDRGVRLPDLELRRGRVAGLDDPLEASVAVAHEPAVVPGIVVLDAEHRCCGAGGEVRVEQLAQHLGGQQHGVAREDEHVLGTTLERGARRPDGVAGAARQLLHRDLVALEVAARLRRGNDDDRVGADITGRMEHPVDHPAAEQRVQVLRYGRAHPGSEAGGHDDGCDRAVAHVGGIDGWGARIRTWDRGTKTRCLTAWLRPTAAEYRRGPGAGADAHGR